MISSPTLSRFVHHCGLVILCWALNDTTSLQSLNLELLNKMATSLAQNKTLKRLELRSEGLTQYKDAKLFTQHLMLGAAGSTTLTGVYTGFSSWWRDCHIQSECAFLSCIVTVGHLHSLCWSLVDLFLSSGGTQSYLCHLVAHAQTRPSDAYIHLRRYRNIFNLSYNSFVSPCSCYKQAVTTRLPQQA